MKLSIIIPVYKVEAYLDFCLKSIARQNVDDCEVILVDDGSPDGSGALCDEWARKAHLFHVVHSEKNQGLSAARNKGLDLACGDFVTFVDSDDYLSPGTLGSNLKLLESMPEADVLEYPARLMIAFSTWLENLYFAAEAEENALPNTIYLKKALEALEELDRVIPHYCRGRWQHWYDASTKVNLSQMREMLRQKLSSKEIG